MQAKDESPKDSESQVSRPTSRKNSLKSIKPLSKRSTASPPASTQGTPKRSAPKQERFEFLVTGKQMMKRSDRANSLPGGFSTRRPSLDSIKARKGVHSAKGNASVANSQKGHEISLEDNMSLDLSQLSDFNDASSRLGPKNRFAPASTSTPKATSRIGLRSGQPPRQTSSKPTQDPTRDQSLDSSKNSCSFVSSNSICRSGFSTELDYSSVSPEYSAPSSADASPRTPRPSYASVQTPQLSDGAIVSPLSSNRSASSCYISWLETDRTQPGQPRDHDGEWASFWANYNSSISRAPMMKGYYDQCPTPFRSETIDLADLDFTAQESIHPSQDHVRDVHNVITTEGLHLTPRETQNLIKAAHMLGSVLGKAIDRNSRQVAKPGPPAATTLDPAVGIKKKSLTLDLKDHNHPLAAQTEPEEQGRRATATTQTDISLPNTRSAPKIFEKILRQLSRSSLDEAAPKQAPSERLDCSLETPQQVTSERLDCSLE